MADLRREYGIDLLDLWRGQLSFYELCAYLHGLPSECATARRARQASEKADGWDLTDQLLGVLIDTVRNMLAESPVDSVMPRELAEESPQTEVKPMSALAELLGTSPQQFMSKHGK